MTILARVMINAKKKCDFQKAKKQTLNKKAGNYKTLFHHVMQ